MLTREEIEAARIKVFQEFGADLIPEVAECHARAIESAVAALLLVQIERLKQEAQIHAQEARTANATIAEIYRVCSGGTGEPGNWNGAEPVRARIAELESQLAAAAKDAERLDYLDKNIHSREPDSWDSRFGACKDGDTWCWMMFAPKGVQGSARSILDAAIARTKDQP